MALPIIPLIGALLRGAGAAASSGLRAGGGALLRGAGGAQIARGLSGLRRRPQEYGPFPDESHPAYRPPPAGRLRSGGILGVGLAKMGVSTALGLGLAAKAATSFSEALNNSATGNLRIFNNQIAALASRKEVFGIRQSVRRGKMVSGTTVALGDAMMRMQRNSQPYSALGENLFNSVGTKITEGVIYFQGVLESMGVTEMVRNINDWLSGGNKQLNSGVLDWMRDAAAGGYVDQALNQRPDENPGSRI